MTNYEQDELDWIFTFGFAKKHPTTGEPLRNKYVRIYGTYYDARKKMFDSFGSEWAFQYESEKEAGVRRYGLTELSLPINKQ